MDKISVEVFFPAINKSYEFLLPVVMKVIDAKQLIIKIVCSVERIMINNDSLALCCIDKKHEMESSFSLKELCIKDGSKLLMV